MKVHKFSAIAALKIINELDRMDQQSPLNNKDSILRYAPESISIYKEFILQARDKWITGVLPLSRDSRVDNIKIHEQEDGMIIVKFKNLTFRINGDHVSKEQGI